jgi:hypothetical protein
VEGSRFAEFGYSEKYGRLELAVPFGTPAAEFAKVSERLFGEILQRLPRGCQACLSGEDLFIRERLEHVVRVDLDSMEILPQG